MYVPSVAGVALAYVDLMWRLSTGGPSNATRSHASVPVARSYACTIQRCVDRSLEASPSPYRPRLNVASAWLLTALVTRTRLPQTIGLECARPGTRAFQRTCCPRAASHAAGNCWSAATPAAPGPRNDGHGVGFDAVDVDVDGADVDAPDADVDDVDGPGVDVIAETTNVALATDSISRPVRKMREAIIMTLTPDGPCESIRLTLLHNRFARAIRDEGGPRDAPGIMSSASRSSSLASRAEYSRFWQDDQLHGLEFLSARFVRHAYALHTHDTFVVGVVESGLATFWCGGQHYASGAGSIMLINPGEPHNGQPGIADGYRYRMIYPAATLFASAVRDDRHARLPPAFRARTVVDPPLAQAIRTLHDAARQDEGVLTRESLLAWVLGQLITRHADVAAAVDRPSAPAALRRARECLEDRVAENVRLADLAAEAGLSPFHLLRQFRARFGLPPHAYQRQIRIDRAKALLRQGVPPAEVAHLVGFADQSHLTRWFKRTFGVTPVQFHRAVRG